MPSISPGKNQPVTPGEVRPILLSLAEEKYKNFSASLLPGVDSILGVRLPLLRKLAGRILKSDWEGFLRETKGEYFEETMLKGFVLAQCPISPEERILRLKEFLPEIQNWSICDSVCASVKEASRYPDTYLPFLRECLSSGEEFTLRFGLIMLMDHFLQEDYLPFILEAAASVRHPGYYAKMAAAWVLATCCGKSPQQTLAYFRNEPIDEDILRKAIQKSLESYRVSPDIKESLRGLRASLPSLQTNKAPRKSL